MKTFSLSVLVVAVLLVALSHAEDFTLDGNVVITGEADVRGNALDLGAWANDSQQPGVSWLFQDATTSSSSIWMAHRPLHEWSWQHPAGAGQPLAMKLDAAHRLLLFENVVNATGAAITLDPAGTSAFAGSLQLNGTQNLMPAQTLTAPGSVLNLALGDARYARLGTMTFGTGNTATGSYAVAMGQASTASGAFSLAAGTGAHATGNAAVALGYNSAATNFGSAALGGSNASGYFSSALGGSNASGFLASALGGSNASGTYASAFGVSNSSGFLASALGNSNASGTYASALGNSNAAGYLAAALGGSYASGSVSSAWGQSSAFGAYSLAAGSSNYAWADGSVALGEWTTTYGIGSMATGIGTYTQGYAQTAIGHYNIPQGDPYNWLPDDDLFVIGNGTNQEMTEQNYVYTESYDEDGNLSWIQVYDDYGNPLYNTYTYLQMVPSNAFVVKKSGDTSINGKLNVAGSIQAQGNIQVQGRLRVAPRGDLSMGEFTSEPAQ